MLLGVGAFDWPLRSAPSKPGASWR
jgi:hypothetical protein